MQHKIEQIAFFPLSLLVMVAIVVLSLSGVDFRVPFLKGENYDLVGMDVINILTFIIMFVNLLVVTKPGQNQISHVLMQLFFAIGYLIVFALFVRDGTKFIANTAFIITAIYFFIQAIASYIVNSATAARGIHTGDGAFGGTGEEHHDG